MSYTTAYAVWPGERHEKLKDFRNSHGSAPVVWSKLFARYVDGSGPYPNSGYMFRTEELWPLYKRKDIPEPLRRVLMMTFDDAYVARENYARAADDIRAFLAAFGLDPSFANHWPAIAELFDSNPECPAIGFRWTSVCEDPFGGPWNEETEEYDQPDWSKKWDVYAEFGHLTNTQDITP